MLEAGTDDTYNGPKKPPRRQSHGNGRGGAAGAGGQFWKPGEGKPSRKRRERSSAAQRVGGSDKPKPPRTKLSSRTTAMKVC